jgi:hypothetical protein
MITLMEGLPENVVGAEATGTVTDDDYENVLIPAVRKSREEHGKVRLLYVLGEGFEGWTARAMWQDAKLGLREPSAWERIAVVTDKDWLRHAVGALGWMLPGEVKVFDVGELDAAKGWVAS